MNQGESQGSGVPVRPLQISRTAGGMSGLVLDVTYQVTGWEQACDGLQIVQVFFGSRRMDGLQVGEFQLKTQGKPYDAFVDGGRNSPYVRLAGQAPAHPTRPYYLTPAEVTTL